MIIEYYICRDESNKRDEKYFFIAFVLYALPKDQKSLILSFHRLLYLIYSGVDYKTRSGTTDLIFIQLYGIHSTDHGIS